MAATLRFENVGLRFAAGPEVLSDLSFSLEPGEVALVTGPRGSGKSLLAGLASLMRRPDRGRVHLLGRSTAGLAASEIASLRRCIGVCAERPMLLPEIDATDNAAIPLRIAGLGVRQARSDAAELVGWLGGPDLLGRATKDLTPAEMRCVALARALVARPALAVLDEPLHARGGPLVDRLTALVDQLSRQGTTFLILSDNDWLASRLGVEPFARLADGRLDLINKGAELSRRSARA